MTPNDDRDLELIDGCLVSLFAVDQPVPPAFTADVLRRLQDARWRREASLDRLFYAGLGASGILVLIGLWFGVDAFTTALQVGGSFEGVRVPVSIVNLSGDAAMKLALAGLVLTAIATWRRLGGLLR